MTSGDSWRDWPARASYQGFHLSARHHHIDHPVGPPRYRRIGVPVSSSLVEALSKQINQRVKGTEQFWNNGGLEAVLQVRTAYLSQDGPAEAFHRRRPSGLSLIHI